MCNEPIVDFPKYEWLQIVQDNGQSGSSFRIYSCNGDSLGVVSTTKDNHDFVFKPYGAIGHFKDKNYLVEAELKEIMEVLAFLND